MIEAELMQMIKELGFPIVAYLLMFFHGFKVIQKNSDSIDRLTIVIEQKLGRR